MDLSEFCKEMMEVDLEFILSIFYYEGHLSAPGGSGGAPYVGWITIIYFVR